MVCGAPHGVLQGGSEIGSGVQTGATKGGGIVRSVGDASRVMMIFWPPCSLSTCLFAVASAIVVCPPHRLLLALPTVSVCARTSEQLASHFCYLVLPVLGRFLRWHD